MLEVISNIIDYILMISIFFMGGLKKCGRVTTTILYFLIFSFLIFLKQLRAHGGCLGSERRRRTW